MQTYKDDAGHPKAQVENADENRHRGNGNLPLTNRIYVKNKYKSR